MRTQKSLTLLALLAMGTSGAVFSDERSYPLDRWASRAKTGVTPVANPTYQQECGSCHFPYQPGLLPAYAWEQIMGALSNHYGDNAELSPADTQGIRNYLLNNAAGRTHSSTSKRFTHTGRTNGLPRISTTPYFIKKHDEIPARMVSSNKQVRSFSHCNACHTRAAEGSFREDEVVIPGVGRWED